MDIQLKSEDEEKKLEQISGESNEPDVKEGVVATTTLVNNGEDLAIHRYHAMASHPTVP